SNEVAASDRPNHHYGARYNGNCRHSTITVGGLILMCQNFRCGNYRCLRSFRRLKHGLEIEEGIWSGASLVRRQSNPRRRKEGYMTPVDATLIVLAIPVFIA